MTGRLVLLATSHRVAPGLLAWAAWSVLHDADTVLAPRSDPALVAALGAAGVVVSVVDPSASADLAAADLISQASRPGTVVRVLSRDGDPGLVEAVADLIAAPGAAPVTVDVVAGSWDLPGARLLDLVEVMDRLRSPGGCPWDADQTHESLVEYLVEEAYETVEAIEAGGDVALREELGDLLLQVVFHARIAEEHDSPWSIDDVADGIVAKLVSRHPHVYGDTAGQGHTAEQVELNWAELKATEKGRESVTDGIPAALPALVLASKVLRRSSRVLGLEWLPREVLDAADRAFDDVDGAVGELLLALAQRFADGGIDAEQSLRDAIRRHRAQVRSAEGLPE